MNKTFYQLTEGDLGCSGREAYRLVKITKTRYTWERVYPESSKPVMVKTSQNAKFVGGYSRRYMSPLNKPLEDFIMDIETKKAEKEAAEKARQDAYEAKLRLVESANVGIEDKVTYLAGGSGLQQVPFSNSLGSGIVFFTTDTDQRYDRSYTDLEDVIVLKNVQVWLPSNWRSDEGRYHFVAPGNSYFGKSLAEALYKLIASVWD